MDIQNRFKDLKEQNSYSIPAKRVMEHLKPILSKSDTLKLRWMWELLQNASDLGQKVKAKFIISADTMIFKHNGPNFTLKEAYNLVMPDSSKDDGELQSKSVIGQFGTGFISTHILSKKIHVSGIVSEDENQYEFNFHLDRSERTDKEFLINSVKSSEVEFSESIQALETTTSSEFRTKITYFLNEYYDSLDDENIIDEGLSSFKKLIPFVLAFRPQIEEITLVDKRGKESMLVYSSEIINNNIDDLKIIETFVLNEGKKSESYQIGILEEVETLIAFPLKQISDSKYEIVAFPVDCPKLFCAFPMIGTNEFNFPVVINSETFVPNRERDGLELTEHDPTNRKRLEEARDAYKRLITIIEQYKWINVFNVCGIKNPEFEDDKIKQWFNKEIFSPVKDKISYANIVEIDELSNSENQRKTFRQVYIPYADKRTADKLDVVNRIHSFSKMTISEMVPCRRDYLSWYNQIDFDVFSTEKLDVKKMCELIFTNDLKNLKAFCEKYCMSQEIAIQYLIDITKFILSEEEDELLNTIGIVLNQNNEFAKLKGLKLDRVSHKNLEEGYDEKIKDISNNLSHYSDCRTNLLHKRFEEIESLIDEDNKLEFKDFTKDTDEKLRNFEGNYKDEKLVVS